ncbi:MAG: isoprenylcysteine carboxylmethyltransferase family protein [Candidatus Heimdallarchaeota archaeon]|nr:isoprenylcysteine carboxylmethyltransferase family protein [Candidatus Heimdallarchaeota archaeon]
MDEQVIRIIFAVNLLLYIVIHYPMDIFMILKRDRSKELIDYGVSQSALMNSLLGIFSIVFWIIWYAIVFGWYPTTFLYNQTVKLQMIGAIIFSLGVILAIWARIKRGRYAASWGLNETIPLITTGPYRWIRHPTYTFYLLGFIGLPLLVSNYMFHLLLIGFIGYVKTVDQEEELLVKHFGDEYVHYQDGTKKFIPFIY